MKKIVLTSMFILAGVIISQAQTIKFETDTIDYGTIKKGSEKDRIFKFKNVGKKPLILTEVTASCGCTIPSYPKTPLKPKKSSEIKVTYDTNRVGPFNKTITVNSNDAKNGRKMIVIKGTVTE